MAEIENNETTNANGKNSDLFEQLSADETLEITIRKETNEVILRNPKDNRIVKLKANFEEAIEEELKYDDEDEIPPLTPEEFEDGVRRIYALGLTFSVDLFPTLLARDEASSELIDSDEFDSIRNKYPMLPREVGFVAHNTLTGRNDGSELLGGDENFEKKSQVVKELVLTEDYKAEFFFAHALKVPYFESIDWEVVLKTREKGVVDIISVPYALLLLTFHNTNPKMGDIDKHQNVTVAVNQDLVDKLLATLTEVRTALDESNKVAKLLSANKDKTV